MPTWTLAKTFTFEASHRLPLHDGPCARLHGHSWRGRLIIQGTTLQARGPQTAMLRDYGDLSQAITGLLLQLDHQHLNDTLDLEHPTSEVIAAWIYDRVKPWLDELIAVEIEETCTAWCRYEP
jgi:6-pyruvoyltetrahydropterin/6-carboxytetrahydropterin synthase